VQRKNNSAQTNIIRLISQKIIDRSIFDKFMDKKEAAPWGGLSLPVCNRSALNAYMMAPAM
jgi:hypothetical protein